MSEFKTFSLQAPGLAANNRLNQMIESQLEQPREKIGSGLQN
jgi:hypothetical protein